MRSSRLTSPACIVLPLNSFINLRASHLDGKKALREARFEGETLRRKLDRPMLSEIPLSAATRWETEVYRSRGALRVVRVTKIRRREGRKGVHDLPVTQPPRHHRGSQRGLKFPRSMKQPPPSRARCFSPYFLFSRAVGGQEGRGERGGSLCRETLPFFLSSTLSKSRWRRKAGGR